MSYFDHISCHACKGNIDPDRIKPVEGRLICPYCNTELKLTDLFGIKASFAEDDQPDLTMDDLVPGENGHLANPWGQPEGGHTLNHGRWEPDLNGMDGIHTGQPGAGERRSAPRARSAGGGIPEGAQVARHIDPPGGASGGGRSAGTPRSHQIADNGGRVPERRAAQSASRPQAPQAAPPKRRSSDGESGGGTSALDALRRLKGKK